MTNRLEGVTDVDEIVVLQDGQVTRRGVHDQLLAMPGWYGERLADRAPRLNRGSP